MLFIFVLLAAGLGSPVSEASKGINRGIDVQQVTVSAIEAKIAEMPLSFDGQQVVGQLKGTLTVVQAVNIDDGQFASVDDLRIRSRQLWCPPNFTPRGKITFSAGRSLSANLGTGSLTDQAVARIDLTYRRSNDGSSQTLVVHCNEKRAGKGSKYN